MENFAVDHSMYLETIDEEDMDKVAKKHQLMKRYSVLGNDQTFKQYTKNHAYDTIKFEEKDKKKEQKDVLTVVLKDLEQHNAQNAGKAAKKMFTDEEGEENRD